MSGFDQSSIAVSMPTVIGADAALGGPYKIKPSEAFSGALMTVSGLTGETISVQTSPDGYQGAPANPSFYRTDWQGTSLLYSSARTNLKPHSQLLSDGIVWNTTNLTVALDAIAPDGTLTGNTLTAVASATVTATGSGIVANSTAHVLSFYWKQGTRTGAQTFAFRNITTATTLSFGSWVPTTKTFSSSPGWSAQDVGDGWYRITYTQTTGVTAGDLIAIYPATGTVWTAGETAIVWGFQVESGSVATPYIKTDAAAVTITDYTLSNGVITLAQAPITGATLSYDNSVLPSPYYIFATGDGVRTQFAYDGVWGTLSANSGKGNGIWQIDLRGAQSYQLVKSAGAETATVNMTLKRDALQYKNTAGTWSVT